jgi:hypothetical protein
MENSSLFLSVLSGEILEPMNCVWKVIQSPKEPLMSSVKFLKTGQTVVSGAEIWCIPENSEENTMKKKNVMNSMKTLAWFLQNKDSQSLRSLPYLTWQ